MKTAWIVLVTRTDARVFMNETYEPVFRLKNSVVREKNKKLTYSRPGVARAKGAKYPSSHNMSGETNPHDDDAIHFANKVDKYLEKQRVQNKFDRLIIVAEPRMMGRLKTQMNKNLRTISKWIPKDFGKVKAHQLAGLLGPRA